MREKRGFRRIVISNVTFIVAEKVKSQLLLLYLQFIGEGQGWLKMSYREEEVRRS